MLSCVAHTFSRRTDLFLHRSIYSVFSRLLINLQQAFRRDHLVTGWKKKKILHTSPQTTAENSTGAKRSFRAAGGALLTA